MDILVVGRTLMEEQWFSLGGEEGSRRYLGFGHTLHCLMLPFRHFHTFILFRKKKETIMATINYKGFKK